jgi:hypothetical protein
MSSSGSNLCRIALTLLLLASCTSKLPPASSRWPHNRRLHDQRLEKLEALRLETRILQLEQRVRELETKALAPPTPAPAAPAPTPAPTPATLP